MFEIVVYLNIEPSKIRCSKPQKINQVAFNRSGLETVLQYLHKINQQEPMTTKKDIPIVDTSSKADLELGT
jgi:hypothetical protein